MSAKSKKSSKKNGATPRKKIKNDAFDSAVLKRARKLADHYRLILEPDSDGGYMGRALEMPTVFEFGTTPDACVEATRRALTIAVAYLLESGRRPPAAATQARRSAQINIRVSGEEKLLLEETARASGFRGVSDFVRIAALDRAKAG